MAKWSPLASGKTSEASKEVRNKLLQAARFTPSAPPKKVKEGAQYPHKQAFKY